MHDLVLVGRRAGGPVGQAGAVGVAGAGEVGPVLADLVGELAVFGAPDGLGAGVERAEDVLDVVGVEGSDGCGVVAVAGVAEGEEVAVDGRVAGLDLRLDPAPGGEGDEAVAGEVAGGGLSASSSLVCG